MAARRCAGGCWGLTRGARSRRSRRRAAAHRRTSTSTSRSPLPLPLSLSLTHTHTRWSASVMCDLASHLDSCAALEHAQAAACTSVIMMSALRSASLTSRVCDACHAYTQCSMR
eukprot:600085-Rhodomonas_salina.1